MPKIRNVSGHVDELHDGRAIPAFEERDVAAKDLALDHYQQRLADRRFLIVDEPPAKPRRNSGADHEVTA